jgi:translocation and assembly module TamB
MHRGGAEVVGPIERQRRVRRRRLLHGFVVIAMAMLLAASVYGLASESLVQTLAEYAVRAAGGRLRVEGAQGSLLGTVRVARLVWHDPKVTVAVRQLEWTMGWYALLRGRVRVENLGAAHLDVLTEPSDTPWHPPATLRAPLGFELETVEVDEVVLRETGSDASIPLRHVRGSVRYDRAEWRVSGVRWTSPWGRVHGDVAMADRAPFAIRGQAQTVWSHAQEDIVVTVQAQGHLSDLHLDARSQWQGATWHAVAQGVPWAAQPLARLHLNWSDLDAARWHAQASTTRLSGSVSLEAEVGAVPWSAQWPTLRGRFTAINSLPGTISAGRVPWTRLETRWVLDAQRLYLEDLHAAGPPGSVTGRAEFWDWRSVRQGRVWPKFEVQIATKALNVAEVVDGMRATALRGSVEARAVPQGVAVAGQLEEGAQTLSTALLWTPEAVRVHHARWSAGQGYAELSGDMAMAAPYRFMAKARLVGFEPHLYVAVPAAWGAARLQGSIQARGHWGAQPQVDAEGTLFESRWREWPLRARWQLHWQPEGVQRVDMVARWGSSNLSVQGALGRAADRLLVQIEAPRLREWRRDWAGHLRTQIALSGSLSDPAVAWEGSGQALDFGPLGAMRELDGRGTVRGLMPWIRPWQSRAEPVVAPPRRGPPVPVWEGQMDLREARWGDWVWNRLEARLHGDALAHGLTLHAVAAAPAIDLRVHAAGGWREGVTGPWSGKIQEAVLGGEIPVRLREPAALSFGRSGLTLQPVRLEIDGADGALLDFEQASWREGRMRLQGRLQRASVRWLRYWPRAAFSGLRFEDAGALRLGARIDLTGEPGQPGGLQGVVELMRESGDLVFDLPGSSGRLETVAAGLNVAMARFEVAEGFMKAALTLEGSALGTLKAQAQAPWVSQGGHPWPAWDAPVRGQLAAELPSLAFARALAGEAWRFSGSLSAQAELTGTLAAPRLSGQVRGTQLFAEQRELGMRLTDGVLLANLRNNVLEIETLRFVSGRGRVSLTGALRPDERSQAVLVLDRLPIPLGAGQRLVVSGEARASLRGGELALRGALRADEGVLELSSRNTPRVSDDVVRVRDTVAAAEHRAQWDAARRSVAEGAERSAREPRRDERGFRIVSALSIDLGDAFRVFGNGLESRLTGQLTLQGFIPDAPRLHGTLRMVQGTYIGFGQKLEIERGVLVFSGPVDNPAIDVLAYRRYLPVEAGVALTGTAQNPRLVLVSRPDVPEPDKLSWLVLGVGADQSRSGGQSAALQAAAATLLASADPSMTGPGLAKSFGLDVVSIRTGQAGGSGAPSSAAASAQDSIVMLGKRLSQRIFVSYEQSLRGLQNLVRLQYEITERLSVRGRAGTQNGLDLLWTYRYD